MANRYFLNTGNVNWTTASNWSATDGGVTDSVLPTSTDTVFLTALSGNIDTSGGSKVCGGLDCTGYTHALTISSALTVNGNVTLSATMTIPVMTNALTIGGANSTLISNGLVLIGTLSLGPGVNSYTLVDNWTVQNFTSAGGAGDRTLVGSSTVFVLGNLTMNARIFGGNIFMNGTGTMNQATTSTTSKITIDTTGTITFTGTFCFNSVFTYIKGTVITTGATIALGYASTAINMDFRGLTVDTLVLAATGSVSMLSDVNVAVQFTISDRDLNGPGKVYVSGNMTSVTGNNSGTGTIVLNGIGTWSSNGAFAISANITIDTTGTITISGAVWFGGNFTYVKGTVVTIGSTVSIGSSRAQTIDSGSMVWNDIQTISNSVVITLLSNLIVGGSFNLAVSKTFNGSSILVSKNLTITGTLAGTSTVVLNGTGTWSGAGFLATSATIINTPGTLTVSGTVLYNTGTLTYMAGTVVTTGSTLQLSGLTNPAVSLNTGTILWDTIAFVGNLAGYTLTLLSNLNCNTFLFSTPSTNTKINGFSILTKTLTNSTTQPMTGTTKIVFTGIGTWSVTQGSEMSLNVDINVTGTLTVTGNIIFSKATLKYIAGTVVTTGSTLTLGDMTGGALDTSTVSWNNIVVGGLVSLTGELTLRQAVLLLVGLGLSVGINITTVEQLATFVRGLDAETQAELPVLFTVTNTVNLISALNAAGSMTLNTDAITWQGVGFTVGTLNFSTGQVVFNSTATYRATAKMTSLSSTASVPNIKSSVANTLVKLILNVGGICNMGFVGITDVDASGGRTITIFNGFISSNCINVVAYSDPIITYSRQV